MDGVETVWDGPNNDSVYSQVENWGAERSVTGPVCGWSPGGVVEEPEIYHVSGDNPLRLKVARVEEHAEYVDPGALAKDQDDDDTELTGNIVVGGDTVDPTTTGTYVITYNVTDSEGFEAEEATRTVIVEEDTEPPVITLVGASPLTLKAGTSYIEPGATAEDFYDGIVPGIMVDASGVDMSTPTGLITDTYTGDSDTDRLPATMDEGGAITYEADRILFAVADAVSLPHGARMGSGDFVYTMDLAMDELEGIGGQYGHGIQVHLGPGGEDYISIRLQSWGDPMKFFTARAFAAETHSAFSLDEATSVRGGVRLTKTGDTIVASYRLEGGDWADLQTYDLSATEYAGAEWWLRISSWDNLGLAIPFGIDEITATYSSFYTVTYSVSDSEANLAETERIVFVEEDTTGPDITLVGDATVSVKTGTVYMDAGATATDNFDGDVTDLIVGDWSAVDTSTPDSYTVTYNASDSEGNAGEEAIRTVIVENDTVAPEIVLVGDDTVTMRTGGTYEDEGATATDIYDGDLTDSVVVDTSALNAAAAGSYTVTYNVDDLSGNAATEVTRTVEVEDDVVAPEITLVGEETVTIKLGSTYEDDGATATDDYDGDLTDSIVAVSGVDTATADTFTVTYNVSDLSDNAATEVTRTVVVEGDTVAPEITLVEGTVTMKAGTSLTDPGATATDNYDGDLTADIVVDSSGVATATIGSYTMTYDVSDTSGNAAVQAIRTVVVEADTVPPVITLTGDETVMVKVGTSYEDDGATATDNYDGDITDRIEVTPVDHATVGTYIVTYMVSDAEGNETEATRTVIVAEGIVDAEAPVITLAGGAEMRVLVDTDFVDPGATAVDNLDGDLTSNIEVAGDTVDTATEGTSTLTYNVSDFSDNAADEVIRTVVVVAEIDPPVITLTGEAVVVTQWLGDYEDAGATAMDGETDLTDAIVTDTSAVDTGVLGAYTVTYTVSDAAGNTALATRTVIVRSSLDAPVITLTGDAEIKVKAGGAYTDAGATAVDHADGILTDDIVVGGDTVDTATVGTYTISYSVTDSDGNAALAVERDVIVEEDTGAPVITLTGESLVYWPVDQPYVDAGAMAMDDHDGDLTGSIMVSEVDFAGLGTDSYSLIYSVADLSGNSAAVTRTVIVEHDMTPPVITLTGDDLVYVALDTSYTDAGATVADDYDGDLTDDIVADVSAVDTSTLGTYTVTYNVTDSAGNSATEVTRAVSVELDVIEPVITLSGDGLVLWQQLDHPYLDPGATAVDNYDGDLTANIVTSELGVFEPGTFQITYNVSDAAGNAALEVTRTVIIVPDYTPPGIELTGDAEMSVGYLLTYDEPGAIAVDNIDDAATLTVVIGGDVVDTTVLHAVYTVTYSASDAAGNAAEQLKRTVIVRDLSGPEITLLETADEQGAFVEVPQDGAYTEPGATAEDVVDGPVDVTWATDVVDTTSVGSYSVAYTSTDLSGNVTVATRTVRVNDVEAPVITLIGDAAMSVSQWSLYSEPGATGMDNIDGILTDSIVITGGVDVDEADTYTVTYNVADAAGNEAVTATRVVTVGADMTAPVITLMDENANPISDPELATVVVPQGGTFEDYGAIATDDVYGNVNSSIVVDTSEVNTAELGTYLVYYRVSDPDGNEAVLTRTVIVESDTVPPVILVKKDPLSQQADQVVSVGETYIDLGASASDNADGDITDFIEYTGRYDVDTSTPGVYYIIYNVTDAANNAAETKMREITVVDNIVDGFVENADEERIAGALVEIFVPVTDSYNIIDLENLDTYDTIADAILVESTDDFGR